MPWVNRLANGSLHLEQAEVRQRAGPEARVEQVQDRVLDPADVLVDGHPPRDFGRLERPVGRLAGERRKYQLELTNVSSVSVSRSAAPPHCGQATCFQVGWRTSGCRGGEVDVLGQRHRQLVLRHRHHAARCRNE
jgi:hypothetical protein